MDSSDSVGFERAFVSILAAGLLTIQSLFVWTGLLAAVWFAANDYGVFLLLEGSASLPARIAIVAAQVLVFVASLVVAPWVAWTYLRSEPRRPTRKERFAAAFVVVANFAWVIWLGLELVYWPPSVYDIMFMTLPGFVAVLVTAVSSSRHPVGLSAS